MKAILFLSLFLTSFSFSSTIEERVIDHYTDIVFTSYQQSFDTVKSLNNEVEKFVIQPTEDSLKRLKELWIQARIPYGKTEAFRFYDGPIDDENGFETWINAWPIDEAYIDKVEGKPSSGIVAGTQCGRKIDDEVLFELNEEGGENDICTGFHAMEFLLWGQDFFADSPGQRPITDFTTAENADRRRDALLAVSRLLLTHIHSVASEWKDAHANYRTKFTQFPTEVALQKIFTGISMLSGFELASERLSFAYETQDQEDEHSCFSDTTHLDLIANIEGIWNVWDGSYDNLSGPGFKEYVAAIDATLAKKITDSIQISLKAAKAVPPPFDQAILGDDSAPPRMAVLKCIEALEHQTELLENFASKTQFNENVE